MAKSFKKLSKRESAVLMLCKEKKEGLIDGIFCSYNCLLHQKRERLLFK